MRTISPRQFVLGFITAISLFVLLHALTWQFAVRQLLQHKNGLVTGDLARLGYISDLVHRRRTHTTLPRRHLEAGDLQDQRVDLLTIGDSFSNGGAGGPNPWNQDFIASGWGWNVLNLRGFPGLHNDMDLVRALLRAGLLQEWGVRYVLLESTQRKIASRYANTPPPHALPSREALIAHYRFGRPRPTQDPLALPDVAWINDGNIKYWWNRIMYHLDDCAFISKACRTRLRTHRFSIGDGRDLLFYRGDLHAISRNNANAVQRMNSRLEVLADELDRQGIGLIVMPVVTKYELYRPDIADGDYPPDPLFPGWRRLSHRFVLVDTQAILRQAIKAGELDTFYIDDSHWTPKASAHVVDALGRLLGDDR
ncbi:alginate O-acetyltransferase AlgX-related protein [endosymbiont of unidentified scaly snail isolate Monju]|uniref:alginate O-acetyltransferase AlgX-related protein n=1 Tax=endosymbiont of unidentified scaly snail isolate Monju TaxID=1248727 RepID=UPI0003892B89|nr:hypothetical protein [endosymbiont of unidentified scaly snail isolate Monju]BAN69801.1 conserved hypothetical protein [endosymbiont of unidentified scaly snail isolate Monju]